MKHLLHILLLAMTCSFASCTHNNGDIGDWFGTWKLEKIEVDGSPAEYDGNIIWKFQSDIVWMGVVDDVMHTATNSFGTWTCIDDILTLNFTYSDNNFPNPGTGQYAPPSQTLIPSGITEMSVLELSSSRIRLLYRRSDGSAVMYHLSKWG